MIKIIIIFLLEKWNNKKRNYNNILFVIIYIVLVSVKWYYNKVNKIILLLKLDIVWC